MRIRLLLGGLCCGAVLTLAACSQPAPETAAAAAAPSRDNEIRLTGAGNSYAGFSKVGTMVLRHLKQLQDVYPGRLIVVVTHAEVIRAVVLHWLEASVDGYYRLVISPASWTRVSIGDWGVRIDGINQQALT